jgi:hypothetical protein
MTTIIKELRKIRDEKSKVTLFIGQSPIVMTDVVIEYIGRSHLTFVASFQTMKGGTIVNQLRRQTVEISMINAVEYVIAEMTMPSPSEDDEDDEGFLFDII